MTTTAPLPLGGPAFLGSEAGQTGYVGPREAGR